MKLQENCHGSCELNLAECNLVCTPKVETEGVQGVVHSIHHVLPLHTISHMADTVANHTIGQILPFHKGKDSKDKKKKKKMVIDLTSLKSVNLSTDTMRPKNFSLQVEIVSAYSHNDKKTNMENNPANYEEKLEDSDDDDDDVEAAAALVLAAKKKNKTSFKRMSVNSYNTGQYAVKSVIKMSNPAKHLSHTFIVIKAVDLSHTTKNAYGKRPVWGESVYVDVNDEDFDMTSVKQWKEIEAKHAAMMALNTTTNTIHKNYSNESDIHNNNNHNNKSIDIEKEKITSAQATGSGFQVFLYRGVSGMEYLIGYQFIPYSLLLPGRYNDKEENNNNNNRDNDNDNNNMNNCSNKSGHSQNQSSIDGSQQSTNPTESSTINSNTNLPIKYPVPVPSSHPSSNNNIHNCSSNGSVSTESYSQSGSGNIRSFQIFCFFATEYSLSLLSFLRFCFPGLFIFFSHFLSCFFSFQIVIHNLSHIM